jgi:POT family proton-dependent oligopeptide transporter
MTTPNINMDFESQPVGPLLHEDQKYPIEGITTVGPVTSITQDDEEGHSPSEEELATLRMVPASMPWPAIAMCLIEFAERASYYGCSGVFSNFIRGKLPVGGPGTGAVAPGALGLTQSSGALGLGLQTATALTTMFTFLAYTVPILGGIIADTKWGRFKTICVGAAAGAVAHVILVIPAIPSVIASGKAVGPFVVGLISLSFAAGFIKPSLGPLLCDQSPVKKQTVVVLKSGESVIMDPQTTVARYLMIFYWAINIGAFFSLATTYAEHDVGYWLAFLLPGILYMLMPIVLVIVYKRLYKAPPTGSVVLEACRVFKTLLSAGGWKRMFKGGEEFWNRAKPSLNTERSATWRWDDQFVTELKNSLSACTIFLTIPIFQLMDGGFGSTENAMSAAMVSGGVPNDLMSNFNSLTIVICAPLLNFVVYPYLSKIGYMPAPMTRMSIGFVLGAISMVMGAVMQYFVYKTSPCGYYASTCDELSTVSLWWQVPLIALPALGELFVNVTSYEIAYTRAPQNMRGLVYALCLFSSALSSALTEIINATPALNDPHLIWPYVALAIAGFACAASFPIVWKDLNLPIDFSDPDRIEHGLKYQSKETETPSTYDEKA